MQFQEALAKCRSDQDIERLANRRPALFAAYEVYYTGAESFRIELDSRILAAEEYRQIAQKLCLAPAAIKWYERVFYNVLDRLDAPSFIVRNCLGGNVHELRGEDDLGVLIRLVGYRLGTAVLDDVLYGFSRRERPDSRSDSAGVFDSSIFRQFRVKMALAVHLTRTDDPKAAARLFKLFLRLRALQEHWAQRQEEHAEITRNIDVAYDGLLATLAHADGPPGSGPSPNINSRVSDDGNQLGKVPNEFLPLAVGMPWGGDRR
jgi:hypothetical protein